MDKIIVERRSVFPKDFSDELVERSEILKLLEAAKWAPTHKLTQPWHFHCFMDGDLADLEQLASELILGSSALENMKEKKLEKMRSKFHASSAIISIAMLRDERERIPEFEEICAVACAVQNIWISMKPMGLAGYWSTGMGTDSDRVKSYLKLGEKDRHLGWLFVGKSETLPTKPVNRKNVEEFVSWGV